MARERGIPWRPVAATLLVLALGYTSLALGTDGWSAWTAEAARRNAVLNEAHALPDYPLTDSHGNPLTLASHAKPLLVADFIYTRCPSVCLAMGAQLRVLQGELASAGLRDQVDLLSITFDPDNDDAAALAGYLERFQAVEPGWRAARFEDDGHLRDVLDELGVIVIPEPSVGFVHNAAFYLIERGHVVEIVDVEDRAALFDAIRERAPS